MDTRVNVFTLIDFKEVYGYDQLVSVALNLIRNIPSITLLNYLSGFNVNLYLRENFEHSGKIQAYIIDSVLSKAPSSLREKWKAVLNLSVSEGHAPVLIWNYSNLLFYELLFKRFNNRRSRDLSLNEAESFFKAYLIINSFVNSKITAEEAELQAASESDHLEEITMPGFIYQKDYASTTDFSNQIVRGVLFFQFLEAHPKFNGLVQDYYSTKNITGYLRMFKNLMTLFTELKILGDLSERNQLVNLEGYALNSEVDLAYIETLCINPFIKTYAADQSFGQLRKSFLFKWSKYLFFVLDVNFLIDNFYKAQVFEFNNFLKSKGIKEEFLSIKGKEFMEDIYLPQVINACFPDYVKYYGDDCKNSQGEQLTDVYLRDFNNVCLVEFKDVLLNAAAKNSGDRDTLITELDKKFLVNQKKKPKGLTQLFNAIKDVDKHGVIFDKSIPVDTIEIFPIILYTDFSFGIEGLNKIYREKFGQLIKEYVPINVKINEPVFVNLNFFELHELYFSQNLLNLFTLLKLYLSHIKAPEYHLTPFEVFCRFYMNENVLEDLGAPPSFQRLIKDIAEA